MEEKLIHLCIAAVIIADKENQCIKYYTYWFFVNVDDIISGNP